MNPTKSGYDSADPRAREKYLSKLSGPLLDRIDIHVEVPAVPYRELTGKHAGTSSQQMRQHVERARKVQQKPFGARAANASTASKQRQAHCQLTAPSLLLVQ